MELQDHEMDTDKPLKWWAPSTAPVFNPVIRQSLFNQIFDFRIGPELLLAKLPSSTGPSDKLFLCGSLTRRWMQPLRKALDPFSGFPSRFVESCQASRVSESFRYWQLGAKRLMFVCVAGMFPRGFGFAACHSNRVIKESTKNNLVYRTTKSLTQTKNK